MTISHFAGDKDLLKAAAEPQQGPPPGGGGQNGPPPMGGMPGPGQQGQAQHTASLAPRLARFALPSGPITEKDLPEIKATMEAVCAEISASIKSAGKKVDDRVIQSGVLGFQDWLKRQPCVEKPSSPYSIQSADKYASEIFATYPGMLPFHFEFKMAGDVRKPYRLMLFITKVDLFSLAVLVENKTIHGVPVPKDWPLTSWTDWSNRS